MTPNEQKAREIVDWLNKTYCSGNFVMQIGTDGFKQIFYALDAQSEYICLLEAAEKAANDLIEDGESLTVQIRFPYLKDALTALETFRKSGK